MVELMQSYGEFVLTGYYTGGRASALFYGVDTNSIQFDSKETDMDVAINASYAWKNNNPTTPGDTINSASGNLSIGTKRGKLRNNNRKILRIIIFHQNSWWSIWLQHFNSPYDITNYSIDLTPLAAIVKRSQNTYYD